MATPSSSYFEFEMLDRDGLARIGQFSTPHGQLPTPALLPVINPNYLTITPKEMEAELPVSGYITNGYIIKSTKELKVTALEKGVHALLETKLPIMTDSGTFQMYVYGEGGKKEPDPNEMVKFQAAIKSDIITILDKFTDHRASKDKAQARADETYNRAKEAVLHKNKSALACTVQGGVFPELREVAAKKMSEVDCEVHPIGGMVPLMENYLYADMAECIIAAKKGLRQDRPVHLFGAGHPMVFPLAVMLGCDIFDSSSYAKYAQNDRLMYPEGTRHLADMEESPCLCPVCNKYPVKELAGLGRNDKKKQIALHNLHVSFNELSKVRQAVTEETLRELVEQRAASHPKLFETLNVLKKHERFLERYEPLSRKRFFYTGSHSSGRPEVLRYKQRFYERYKLPDKRHLIIFEDSTGHKPYSAQFAADIESLKSNLAVHFVVISYFGPAPLELEDIYPIAQSVIPQELCYEDMKRINSLMERFAHRNPDVMGIVYDGEQTIEFLTSMGMDNAELPELNMDLLKLIATADMQFGSGAGFALAGINDISSEDKYEQAMKGLKFRKSKKTGRIRNVQLKGEHILSFRASDGYISLRPEGAEILRKIFPPPALRVVVAEDSVSFNREGKNVFAKFVIDRDENLRPGDEALIVDEKDNLVALGRVFMTADEMKAFGRGVAVKVREGIKEDH